MKRLYVIAAITISFLSVSCSSENKQEHMADTSIANDSGLMDTNRIYMDTADANSPTPTGRTSTTGTTNGNTSVDSVNRSTTVNRDSVRQ